MRVERDLPESSWKTLAMKAVPILNARSRRRLDGSSPDDVQDAIESKDPENKVLEFKRLKATAEGLKTNHDEHASIVKKLEAAGGFRAPTTYRTGRTHGMKKIGEKKGEGEMGEQDSHVEGWQSAHANGNWCFHG